MAEMNSSKCIAKREQRGDDIEVSAGLLLVHRRTKIPVSASCEGVTGSSDGSAPRRGKKKRPRDEFGESVALVGVLHREPSTKRARNEQTQQEGTDSTSPKSNARERSKQESETEPAVRATTKYQTVDVEATNLGVILAEEQTQQEGTDSTSPNSNARERSKQESETEPAVRATTKYQTVDVEATNLAVILALQDSNTRLREQLRTSTETEREATIRMTHLQAEVESARVEFKLRSQEAEEEKWALYEEILVLKRRLAAATTSFAALQRLAQHGERAMEELHTAFCQVEGENYELQDSSLPSSIPGYAMVDLRTESVPFSVDESSIHPFSSESSQHHSSPSTSI